MARRILMRLRVTTVRTDENRYSCANVLLFGCYMEEVSSFCCSYLLCLASYALQAASAYGDQDAATRRVLISATEVITILCVITPPTTPLERPRRRRRSPPSPGAGRTPSVAAAASTAPTRAT